MSNGVYRSIEHRVIVNVTKERLSMATFYSTRPGGAIGPAPSLINEQKRALFKTVTLEEYFKRLFSHELNGKYFLDEMRI